MLRPMLKVHARVARPAYRALGAGLLALAGFSAQAAPAFAPLPPLEAAATAADALGRYLADQGLVTAAPNSPPSIDGAFVERVRDRAATMVRTAMNFMGVPYRRGGTSAERGFDCSGFTRAVFEASLGLVLPRLAEQQAAAPSLVAVQRNELQPGDLVFFKTLRRTFSHVGIYVGEGKFIHAPRPGGEVRVEDLRFTYWAKRYTGARRAEPIAEQAAADPQSTEPLELIESAALTIR